MARNVTVASPGGYGMDWLVDAGLLTPDQLHKAVDASKASGQPLRKVIDHLGLVSQRAWAEASADATGLTTIDASGFPKNLPSDDRLSVEYMQRNGMAILSLEGASPRIAIADPTDTSVRQALGILFGRSVDYVVATERDIEEALSRSSNNEEEAESSSVVSLDVGGGDFDTDRLMEMANNAPTVRYLDWLFSKAVESRATDIHIEMLENQPRVRLRIDGVLADNCVLRLVDCV